MNRCKNEVRPGNLGLRYAICANGAGSHLPSGIIELFLDGKIPHNFLELNGGLVSCEEYPELFNVLKYGYGNSPKLQKKVALTKLQKVLAFFGFKPKLRITEVDNPAYVPGFFRLPDFND